jgi:hypothetical protein
MVQNLLENLIFVQQFNKLSALCGTWKSITVLKKTATGPQNEYKLLCTFSYPTSLRSILTLTYGMGLLKAKLSTQFRKMLGLNAGRDTDYLDWYSIVPQCIKANAGTASQITTDFFQILSSSPSVHHPTIDVIYPSHWQSCKIMLPSY